MSTDTNVLDKNPVPTPVSGSVAQSQVGSLNKEAPLATSGLPELKPAGSETKHSIGQELAELGVKEEEDRPDLTRVSDVNHAGPHVPVPTSPLGKVEMPMSEEEIAGKLKTGQDDDSGKWFAALLKKIIAVMGLKIN